MACDLVSPYVLVKCHMTFWGELLTQINLLSIMTPSRSASISFAILSDQQFNFKAQGSYHLHPGVAFKQEPIELYHEVHITTSLVFSFNHVRL
jgi:hypothetical protein